MYNDIALPFFYHDGVKVRVRTNYKLHEMKKFITILNRTHNLLKVTCRLK